MDDILKLKLQFKKNLLDIEHHRYFALFTTSFIVGVTLLGIYITLFATDTNIDILIRSLIFTFGVFSFLLSLAFYKISDEKKEKIKSLMDGLDVDSNNDKKQD